MWSVSCLADADAQHVWEAVGVARSSTVADGLHAHRRLLAEGRAERAKQGCSSWSGELVWEAFRVRWIFPQQISGGGRGHWEAAVRAFDGSCTDVYGRRVPGIYLQMVDPSAGGDDIDDGIDRTDFVKVDLLDWNIVNLCFRLAEQLKGAYRKRLYLAVERRGLNEIANLRQGSAMRMIVVRMMAGMPGFRQMTVFENVYFDRRDAAAVYRFNVQAGVQTERGGRLLEHV